MAIAEKLALDRGIRHAFADTDSMFFVRPDDMERNEFQRRVSEIAGPTGWFQALNPYTGNDPVFNIEDVNFKIECNKENNVVRDEKGNGKLDRVPLSRSTFSVSAPSATPSPIGAAMASGSSARRLVTG